MAIIVMNRYLYFLGAFAITLLIDLEKTMTFMDDLVMALIMYISVVCKVNLHLLSELFLYNLAQHMTVEKKRSN